MNIIIFDLDGTLLNTLGDLHICFNYAIAKFGYPKRTLEEIRSFVGNGIKKSIERALPYKISDKELDTIVEEFKEYYLAHMQEHTEPYNNVIEMLKTLKETGWKIGVVSNKYDDAVKELCKKYFGDLVEIAIGEGYGVQKKPAKDGILKVVEKFEAGEISDNEIETDKVENKKKVGTIFSTHKTVKNVGVNDFKIVKVIGRGSYGKVCLVEFTQTKELFAMKSLKKNVLLDEDQVESTLLEKNILQSLDYPFLVGMVFCFQTEERVYFVLPFIQGGELFQHLRKYKYFPEANVKFYASIIGLSLEYLHKKGIVYRDIKPENILLESDGYLKLIDFGMAKILKGDEKTNSFCGTPEYLAPEIITGEGHNRMADWWSYGTLVYEMLFGIPPFFNENIETMYELITNKELRFPKKFNVSDEAKDLLKKLLVKNQTQRFGINGGFDEIKKHPFFIGIDFKALEEKKIEAPFKPKLEDSFDVTNFDDEFTSEELVSSEITEKNMDLIKKNQDQFDEFDEDNDI